MLGHDQCAAWELEIARQKEYINGLESLRDAFTARHKEHLEKIMELEEENKNLNEKWTNHYSELVDYKLRVQTILDRLDNGFNVWSGGLLHDYLKGKR
jgi:chromosome segregation ATPase